MSEYRAIAPSAIRGGGPPRSPEGAPPRRRRVTGQVSQLACNECRRTRSKCDGDRPHRCGRCAARGLSCIYEPHTKTQKNDLLKELNRAHERERNLKDMNTNSQVILDIIKNDGHVDEVIRRLRGGQTHAELVDWLRTVEDVRMQVERSPTFQDSMLDVVQRVEKLFAMPEHATLDDSIAAKWTKVTPNTALLRHLFELYFAWVHPHHYLFGEMDMLESFYSGRDTYCSEGLVNAVCAMACHLLEAPTSNAHGLEEQDRWALQKAFVFEARSHLKPHSEMNLLSLQALAVLALVEFSHGRSRSATTYLRCAADEVPFVDLPTHGQPVPRTHSYNTNVSKWGITTLSVIWKSLTYQNHSYPGPSFDESDLIDLSIPEYGWLVYRQKDDAVTRTRRPAFSALTARHMARLAQCAKSMVDLYSGPLGSLHATEVTKVSRKFLEWKRSLPTELAVHNVDDGDQVLPHVCALHILYHAAVVQLWAPLLFATPALSTAHRGELYSKLLENARKGLRLIGHLQRKDMTRYCMPSVAFCVCHIGDTIVRYSNDMNERVNATLLCLEVLDKNRSGFNVCGPLSQMLRANATEVGLNLEDILPQELQHGEEFDIDAILDCATRLNFSEPAKHMSRWLNANFSQDWPEAWLEMHEEEYRATTKPLRVTDLLNS